MFYCRVRRKLLSSCQFSHPHHLHLGMHTTQHQQHHTMPNQTVPFNTIPFNTMPYNTIPNHTIQHHATDTAPYHCDIRQGEAYKTSLYFWYFSHFSVSSQRGGGGLEVFTPPLLQSIHTVSILLMDRFILFVLLYFYTFYTFYSPTANSHK